jgi:hypothetical protein
MTTVQDKAEQLLNILYAQENAATAAPTFVSGTAQQDATGNWSTYLISITGASAGTVGVAIGPTSGVADVVVPVVAANAVASQVISVPLPPSWYIKITVTTATIAGVAVIQGN